MAMQLGNKGVQSDINVTPLIDVVLVMLIIFMVLTPTIEARFKLALPETAEDVPELEEPPPPESQPLLVELDVDGKISLNGEELDQPTLVTRLRKVLRKREEKVAFFNADEEANYGLAVEVMDACREAGAEHIGIVDPEAAESELPPAPTEVVTPAP